MGKVFIIGFGVWYSRIVLIIIIIIWGKGSVVLVCFKLVIKYFLWWFLEYVWYVEDSSSWWLLSIFEGLCYVFYYTGYVFEFYDNLCVRC